jgi:hypothetical protein
MSRKREAEASVHHVMRHRMSEALDVWPGDLVLSQVTWVTYRASTEVPHDGVYLERGGLYLVPVSVPPMPQH